MKKYTVLVFVVLICILVNTKSNFAQTLPELGVLNGKAKTLVKPDDPFDVIYGSLSGAVNVNVTVDEKGNVIKADAVSGDERLRYAAVTAAQESKFPPFIVKGKPSKVKGFLTFEFGAQNKSNLEEFIRKAVEDGNTKSEAQRLYDKGDYDGAIKLLTKIVDNAFYNTSEREFRARCYFKLKDYKNALQDTNDAINITKENTPASAFNLQGNIYVQLNDFPKAVESYTKVIEIDPKFIEAYRSRGILYLTGNYKLWEKSISDFSKIIELDPKNINAYSYRGYAYAKLAKKVESTADFKRVIELDPFNRYAKYNLDALANDRKVLSMEEYKKLKQIYYV